MWNRVCISTFNAGCPPGVSCFMDLSRREAESSRPAGMQSSFRPPRMPRVFSSFWMAGFESSCHINCAGVRLDMIAATQHDAQLEDDYARLRPFGMSTIREAVRWHLVDRGGRYDFSSLAPMVFAAQKHGLQVIWSL